MIPGTLSSRRDKLFSQPPTEAMDPNKYNQKRYCLERFIDALSD